MRAAVQIGYGAIDEAIVVRDDMPDPAGIGAGEVRIRLRGAALNRKELFALADLRGPGIRPRPPLPHVPGADGWGVVEAVGEGVTSVAAGDRVVIYGGLHCGACRWCVAGEQSACVGYGVIGEQTWGTLADAIVVSERNVERVPDDAPADLLSCACASWVTAWRGLITAAQVRPGETVLVVGASGGVGTAAVRIASMAGARVIATTLGAVKAARVRDLGADVVIDVAQDASELPDGRGASAVANGGFAAAVLDATNGEGVDVAVDATGAATWPDAIRSLAPFGRLVTSGATSGDAPAISIREIYQRHRRIIGAPLGSRRDFRELLRALLQGRLSPVVHATLPLSRVREGLHMLARREVVGKVAIALDE